MAVLPALSLAVAVIVWSPTVVPPPLRAQLAKPDFASVAVHPVGAAGTLPKSYEAPSLMLPSVNWTWVGSVASRLMVTRCSSALPPALVADLDRG